MLSQILRDARKYEETMERGIDERLRPGFHLSARIGWMNDPNGFSFYKGEYHLFYQYHPYNCQWGPMHWGHAVSKDLLHWRYLPAALAPETDYDRDGCFSGSAAVLADGSHLLMYTGVSKETQPDGSTCDVQKQCIAVGDGADYEKYTGNPVLDQKDLPECGSRFDFRDPKIWQKQDGSYRCVAGNCTEEKDGQILLYSSPDGFHWKYEKILASNQKRFGRMWECPDFFALDGKQVLLISPQDMLPQGFEYHNGNGTVCLIGSYDDETEEFTEEADQAVDYGIDFYAPQTVLAPDGRLMQTPVRELEKLRGTQVKHENVTFSGITGLAGVKGRKMDMELSIRPAQGADIYKKFAVRFAQKESIYTAVSFRPYESIVKIDRKFSGSRRAIIHQRRCLVKHTEGRIKLRIILDNFSAEVFVNDGEYVLSATIYTDAAADGISFFADGDVTIDVIKYDLLSVCC